MTPTPTPSNFYDDHARDDAPKLVWNSEIERQAYDTALRQGRLFEFCGTFGNAELDDDAFQFQRISPRETDPDSKE